MVSAKLPKHTCSSCGFLAVQVPSDESVVESTGLTYRETGWQTSGDTFTNAVPMCFVLAQRIDRESEKLRTQGISQTIENVMAVIQKPRPDCPEWMEWVPWLSPKEHREMMDRERMLRWQAAESRKNWCMRVLEIAVVTLGVGLTAWFMIHAANIEAEATREAADRQIQFQERHLPTP